MYEINVTPVIKNWF